MVSSSAFAKRGDPGSVEDVQDVLFLHDSRPVLIRLHIRVDGKPYPTRWKEYLTRWFHFLDRDENGFLDGKEAARAPAISTLEQLLSNPYTYRPAPAPAFEELDRDRDKKVSLDELLRFYRRTTSGPVRLAPQFNQYIQSVQQNALTDALYTLLDKDKDGKLSRAELAEVENALRKYDQDDDEVITLQELQAAVPTPPVVVRPNRPLVRAMQAAPFPLVLVPREDAPRRIVARLTVAKQLLSHYDKNKNKSLSRDEIGLSKELFDHLDASKDGELDTLELLRWIIVTPDAEVVVRLGRVEDKQEAIAPAGAKNSALEKKAGNRLTYSTAEQCLNLIAAPSMVTQNPQQVRQVLIQQFKTADQKQKGYLTKQQVKKRQFYFLNAILEVADRDGDDCLDLEDLNAWLDLTTSGLNCQISVSMAASGRGLFQLLDADQDGRLGLRELRNVWKQLAPYDQQNDDAISRNEIPLQYQIVLNPGTPNYRAGQFSGFRGTPGTMGASATPSRGPLWFRKMDRNGDGDVSRREFLGSRDDFRRVDRDGDGLISVEEALRADAALRKK